MTRRRRRHNALARTPRSGARHDRRDRIRRARASTNAEDDDHRGARTPARVAARRGSTSAAGENDDDDDDEDEDEDDDTDEDGDGRELQYEDEESLWGEDPDEVREA